MNIIIASFLAILAFIQEQPDKESATPAEVRSSQIKRGHVASFPRWFTGKVTDNAGKPVSNACIEWTPSNYPKPKR